jgi:LacI family transcriptional regulator
MAEGSLTAAAAGGAAGPESRRAAVTLTEVAARAGVSRATTARALGGYGSVSEAARQLVLRAAAELKYRPNMVARSTRTGTASIVGIVVADIGSPFFGRSTRSIADTARAAGLEAVVVNTDEEIEVERSAVGLLLRQRVAGIVVAPASRTEGQHLTEAQAAGAPVVLLDRRVRGVAADRVYSDNESAATAVMSELISRGHRRIAYVSSAAGPEGAVPGHYPAVDDLVTSAGDRIRAYLRSLSAAGVEAPDLYLRLCPFGEEAARQATAQLLALPEPPTAVFASDGVIALGVLRAVHDAGLEIPRDISVVAGDDPSWSRVTTPALSAVAQPVHELGQAAMNLLLERIGDPARPIEERVLPAEFRSRGSIGSPP